MAETAQSPATGLPREIQALEDAQKYDEAFPMIKQGAEGNNPKLQSLLGRYYLFGQGTPVSADKALVCFSQACGQNEPSAFYYLGLMNELGFHFSRSDVNAVSLYRAGASLGYAQAQLSLGLFWQNGRGGLARNQAEAAQLFSLAADQGLPRAQALWGIACLKGDGTPKDLPKAILNLEAAAKANDRDAQYRLGLCYLQGTGVEKNRDKGLWLLCQSAENGNQEALKALR